MASPTRPGSLWPLTLIENPEGLRKEHAQEYEHDQSAEANSLYSKLRYVILPLFYGSPNGYARVMRSTIAINGSYFTAQRMVQQYGQTAYDISSQFAS